MLRESDWGDENYGNWKEIAKHPENYKKVTACMLKKMALLGIDFSVQEVLGMLATGSAIYYLAVSYTHLFHVPHLILFPNMV